MDTQSKWHNNMLPRIHLGTLMTVTDTHIADKAKRRKQAVLEARVTRSMEGFCIYQTYLKRLRRMHRAYIAKLKQQRTQEKYPLTNAVGSQGRVFHSNNQNKPLINHRLSLARALTSKKEEFQTVQVTGRSTPERCLSQSQEDLEGEYSQSEQTIDDNNYSVEHRSQAIRIPCGREDSFEISQMTNTPRISLRIREGRMARENNNYLPFRLWKEKEVKSLYTPPAKPPRFTPLSPAMRGYKASQTSQCGRVPKVVPKFLPRLGINNGDIP